MVGRLGSPIPQRMTADTQRRWGHHPLGQNAFNGVGSGDGRNNHVQMSMLVNDISMTSNGLVSVMGASVVQGTIVSTLTRPRAN